MKLTKFILLLLGIIIFSSCGNKNIESKTEIEEEIIETSVSQNQPGDLPEEKENEEKDIFDLSLLNSVDLNDNPIDSSIFENKYTLVNVWATNCRPCVIEMPDLQKLQETLGGDDFQVIGIISDTYSESEINLEAAKKIVEQTGVKYSNIIPNDQIIEEVLMHIQFVPTTFIVDSDGKFIGEMVYGLREYDFFEAWVNTIK